MSGTTPPNKKELLYKLLERGSVFVHLDPRRERVAVPQWLATKPQLVLQLGLNFPIPIRDLEIDDDGIRCTLSFNRSPFYCILPWSAVYALVGDDGQVTVWPSELPSELVAPGESAARKDAPRERRAPKSTTSRAEKRDRGAAADLTDAPPPSAPPPLAGRPRIALVKPLPEQEGATAEGAAKKADEESAVLSVREDNNRKNGGSPQTVGDLDRMGGGSSYRDNAAARIDPEYEAGDDAGSDGAAARDGNAARKSTPPAPSPGLKKPARERPPYLRLVK